VLKRKRRARDRFFISNGLGMSYKIIISQNDVLSFSVKRHCRGLF
jgi:hypothetical protein